MRAWAWGAVALGMLSASNAAAQAPPRPPPAVAAKIAALDAACVRAGGRPVAAPYVFVHDFDGDGRTDFLVSEGNYQCAGRPQVFRTGVSGVIEIYIVAGPDAVLAYREQVRGYRILNTTPRTVQVLREPAACGPGATTSCPATLAWDASRRAFALNGRPASGPAPRAAQAAVPPPAAAGGVREDQAQFQARCRRETLAGNPSAARWVDGACREKWVQVQATGPAADGLLAMGPGAVGPPPDLNTAKARLAGAAWTPRPAAGSLASGRMGQWAVALKGRAGVEQVELSWARTGGLKPFDLAEALRSRGLRVTEVACQQVGVGEYSRVFSVAGAGPAPFGFSLYERDAPTADAESFYNAVVNLRGTAPTLASLRGRPDGADFHARCDG